MASLLVFYDDSDPDTQKKFATACEEDPEWGSRAKRFGPGAFRFESNNVNSMKLERLKRQFPQGAIRWITVEDDDIQGGSFK